jgi:hypothetical protein
LRKKLTEMILILRTMNNKNPVVLGLIANQLMKLVQVFSFFIYYILIGLGPI